jgi:hypothetical protein
MEAKPAPPPPPPAPAVSEAAAAVATKPVTSVSPDAATTTDDPRFGVRVTRTAVVFTQPGDPDSRIAVAGDFNSWLPASTPLHYDGELRALRALVRISPGRHQYRLVVDGRWQADPYNADGHVNEHGEKNSVLVVPAEEQVVR